MLAGAAQVVGHALVGRQDLPIPEWLFAWGASLVLIVSFVALTVAWQRSRFERDRWRALRPVVSRALLNPLVEVLCGALGVFLLGLVVWSGLNGTEAPDRNFSVTFVFVTFWLGLVVLSVVLRRRLSRLQPLAGDRPRGRRRLQAGRRPVARRRRCAYPERCGRWPAVVGLVAFVWLELVYGQGGFQTVGLTPHTVAVATLVYTAYTFVAMALFGSEKWLERGETFSVYFGMFATPGAVRGPRPPARGPPGALGRHQVGRRVAGLGRPGPAHDRGDHLRRRRRGGPDRARSPPSRAGSATSGSGRWRRCGSPTRSSSRSASPSSPACSGPGSTACTRSAPSYRHARPRAAVRPRLHPDRARLPGRPLLQPRRLPGAGAVHLPALRPARRRLGHLRHRGQRDRLLGDQRQRDLVRPGRRADRSAT